MEDGVQCAEIEKWTNGGVDMNILLRPFSEESFIEYVDNFDISEEVDLHRQDTAYRNNFTILKGVEDFAAFHNSLKNTMMRMKGEQVEDDYSELVAPEKIIASMMKVVDYLWKKEMRHFEETYSLQIESQDDLQTWIKLCEENHWTEHIFYNLMLMKLNLEP